MNGADFQPRKTCIGGSLQVAAAQKKLKRGCSSCDRFLDQVSPLLTTRQSCMFWGMWSTRVPRQSAVGAAGGFERVIDARSLVGIGCGCSDRATDLMQGPLRANTRSDIIQAQTDIHPLQKHQERACCGHCRVIAAHPRAAQLTTGSCDSSRYILHARADTLHHHNVVVEIPKSPAPSAPRRASLIQHTCNFLMH